MECILNIYLSVQNTSQYLSGWLCKTNWGRFCKTLVDYGKFKIDWKKFIYQIAA